MDLIALEATYSGLRSHQSSIGHKEVCKAIEVSRDGLHEDPMAIGGFDIQGHIVELARCKVPPGIMGYDDLAITGGLARCYEGTASALRGYFSIASSLGHQ